MRISCGKDIFFCEFCGDSTVCRCGYNLPHRFCTHIAGGKNSGNIRFCIFFGRYIALSSQIKLVGKKFCVWYASDSNENSIAKYFAGSS